MTNVIRGVWRMGAIETRAIIIGQKGVGADGCRGEWRMISAIGRRDRRSSVAEKGHVYR